MKINLKTLILFFCIFIQAKYVSAAKNPNSPELSSSIIPTSPELIAAARTSSLIDPITESPEQLEYYFFNDNGQNKITIIRIIPVYENGYEDEYEGLATRSEFFHEIIGIWNTDDSYVRETFEFINEHICHYR